MKKLLWSMLLAASVVASQAIDWTTDLNAARKTAQEQKKTVLVNFTGSDWCPWCIKLKKEIFDQSEFKDYAKDKLILVEIDFPRKKEQSDELKKTNRKLAEQYKIEGYPTVVVLNSEGKELGKLGYETGGPKAFLKSLEKLGK